MARYILSFVLSVAGRMVGYYMCRLLDRLHGAGKK